MMLRGADEDGWMTEQIEFAGRDGNRLVADVDGDPANPPAVLLHGGGQTRHSWGTTLTTLAAHGWRTHSVDLRGHGDSEWAADGDYTLDAFAGDVVAIARTFDAAPALVGASLGGLSSLAAIGEHPGEHRPRALVLVDVAPRSKKRGALASARSWPSTWTVDSPRSTRSRTRFKATTRTGRDRPTSKDSRRTSASATAAGIGTGTRRSSAAGSAARTRRGRRSSSPCGCRPRHAP